ncbi:hypothetical protein BATDEDRAFT_27828 [Batrachochytrium dendrobatidis JAM81]|uniref:Conserved oligomeric Golgi complex subunit 7 n=1 Tax=Batrachochytrium dendrobatidis (strain JAM81 / FGSC 10211) TaxID=684364 RepID=F4PC81_BATDJ|nr:uncharacterized protein BATDEDRAFT_27828 [Batrachochytrium dendrobatidis JAM81]EGF77069.1 hypothetical protein BATDEDRAFT_27828 [Batrachochytrium dendrobatidis JAM81]|eukprot:XP_006682175.1 hypothetical protein BATDEDRAFT_27828 [Batrachochytrium dendrobatidis JAM81]
MLISCTVKELITELQLLIQTTSHKLDSLAIGAVSAIPRNLQELEVVQRDAIHLTASLDMVELNRVQEQSDLPLTRSDPPQSPVALASSMNQKSPSIDAAFSQLSLMDSILVRMEATRTCLKEAENWNTLSAEMDAIFISKDFAKAARRFAEAKRSLFLLVGSASYDERHRLLTSLHTQLLDTLKGQLESILLQTRSPADTDKDSGSTRDIDFDAVQRLAAVYLQLDAFSEFCRLYAQTCCGPLLLQWTNACTSASKDKLKILQHFFDQAVAVVLQELDRAPLNPNVVAEESTESTAHLVHALLDFLFSNMTPRLAAWIRGIYDSFESQSELALHTIVQLYTISSCFVQEMHTRLSTFQLQPDQQDSSLSVKAFSAWKTLVLECFIPYQQEYNVLERRNFMQHLPDSSQLNDASSISEFLSECNLRVFVTCEAAVVRCEKLTLGLGLFVVAEEIDKYVVAIANVAIHTLQFLQTPSNTHALIVAGQAATASSLASGNTGNSNTGQDNVPYTSGFASDATDGVYGQDEEWADFRAAVAVHNTVVSLTVRHQMLTAFIWTAMDRSASTCFSTTDTNDIFIARVYLKEMIQQGRIDYNTLHKRVSDSGNHPEPEMNNENPSSIQMLEQTLSSQMQASKTALTSAAIASQKLVFQCLLQRMTREMDGMFALSCWTSQYTNTVAGSFDTQLPEFSLLPLAYMTNIGEQLLALPLHLDTFAGEQSLQYSLATLPGVECIDLEDQESIDVTHVWILSMSRAIESRLMDQVKRIPTLSSRGCRQLATDINYLSNVFSAMEIEPHMTLQVMIQCLECNEQDLEKRMTEQDTAENSDIHQMIVQIASQRGLSVPASK